VAFPSTFLDIQDEVIARVRLDPSVDRSRVKDWINGVYAEVCVETEAVQENSQMSLTAGQSTYTMASTVIRVKQMYVTAAGSGQSRPLVPTSLEQILEWSAANGANTTSQGQVTHFACWGVADITFYPTPTAADVITVYYVTLPTFLSGDGDLSVLTEPYASNCLTEGAAYQAAKFLKDPDALLYRQEYDASLKAFRGNLSRRNGSMTRQFRLTRGDRVTPHDPSTDIRYV
jgi:hypothetical protein